MSSKHVVKQGECINSIAELYGFFPGTLWGAPENESLRKLRKDPDVLFEGDEVFVPDKKIGKYQCATAKRHTFKRKGVPAKFMIRMMSEGEPRDGLTWVLEIGEKQYEGKTGKDGKVEQWIPPNAASGKLTVTDPKKKKEIEDRKGELDLDSGDELPGTYEPEVYTLDFGHLDPVTEPSGVTQRLRHLGYLGDEPDDDEKESAILAFKRDHCGLSVEVDDLEKISEEDYEKLVTVDDKLRSKLVEAHGS